MATSLLSPAAAQLGRASHADRSSPSVSSVSLPLEGRSAPALASSRARPLCAHRRFLSLREISSSENKKQNHKSVRRRTSFGEKLGAGRDEEWLRKLNYTRRVSCCSRAAAARSSNNSNSVQWQESMVTMDDRRRILQQKGCIVWITGLSGSGKSTVAFEMDRMLNSMAKVSYVLDGDKIREGLCKDLGYSAEDRRENIRRVGETAALFADAGLIVVVSFISPYKRDRDRVRELVPTGNFIEVFMDVPLRVCEERDAKGLYKLARQGVIKSFTGIDDPYEKPVNPEIVIKAVNEHGVCISPNEMAQIIIHYLADKGLLSLERDAR